MQKNNDVEYVNIYISEKYRPCKSTNNLYEGRS